MDMDHFRHAGITVLGLRQRVVIDNSDDYTLPMGEGGREERKRHNDTNDNYRIVNT